MVKKAPPKLTLEQVQKAAQEKNLIVLCWPPEKLRQFSRGEITLAELEDIPQQKLYEIAAVGYQFLSQGKWDDAEKIFAGLSAISPYDAYFYLALGSIAQNRGEFAKAEEHYTHALAINMSIPVAYTNRGEVRILLEKLPEAIADFTKAIQLDPNGRDPASLRARVMMMAIEVRINEIKKKVAQK